MVPLLAGAEWPRVGLRDSGAGRVGGQVGVDDLDRREPAVPFSVDERVLKPRVAGFLAVGGSLTSQWKTLALPIMHTATFSMHIAVVDQVQFEGAGTPRSVVLDPAALDRAAGLFAVGSIDFSARRVESLAVDTAVDQAGQSTTVGLLDRLDSCSHTAASVGPSTSSMA